MQNTVGRNCFCSVWKSFSLSSLGSTFAVTLVENLGRKTILSLLSLTLSLSSPEISSVSFSLLQSFPIAFDVWIWKCRVRYKSRLSMNRQSIYRLSSYRKILICRHVDCLLIARLSPIKFVKSHSPSTPLLFHFHSFNFEYDRTISSSTDTSVVFR